MGRIVFLALCLMLMATASYAGTTERVSVDSYGNEGNGQSGFPAISSDGRFVAFTSDASNLVYGDTNATTDVFVHDKKTILTERVSVDSLGNQANGPSGGFRTSRVLSISADGRYVAFESYASNLVLGDTNEACDIFVHDRATKITERVSIDSYGNQADGWWYFTGSFKPSISGNGRYVAFISYAENLIPGGDRNGYLIPDVFVHDRQTGITEMISVDNTGNQGNAHSFAPWINDDGRYIAFMSYADNLVVGDTNGSADIFVRDRQTGITERVSVDSYGNQVNQFSFEPFINGDGRYVAFGSWADNLVLADTNGQRDVFVHDRQTGMTERVSISSDEKQANDHSQKASISSDGRFVVFSSGASNLVPNDSNGTLDIFIHDSQKGTTERASVDSFGNQANYYSTEPLISGNGKYIAFMSYATNLVKGDTNGTVDIFVYSREITIRELIGTINELLNSGAIVNQGIANSLISSLENAMAAQDRGNIQATENMLQAFINKILAEAGKNITEEAAYGLIEAADQLINSIN